MKMQKLFTNRLVLEPQKQIHADRLFELFQDNDLYNFIMRGPPASIQQFRQDISFIERRLSEVHEEIWLNWVMISAKSGELIGQVEVSMNSKTLEFFLAYTTFKAHWKNGYAKEACVKVISHMFEDWKATKAIIEMDIRNQASIHLAESLGATRVAFNPKVQLLKVDWSDEYRYEIINRSGKYNAAFLSHHDF